MKQKGFTPIIILVSFVLIAIGYFTYKNYIDSKGIISEPVTTFPVNTTDKVSTPTATVPITCENAYNDTDRDDDLITISKTASSGLCKLTFHQFDGNFSGFSLLFPVGYHIGFTGSYVSYAIGLNKPNDPPEKIIHIEPILLTDNSSLDFTQPERIIYRYDEVQTRPIIILKNEKIVKKQIEMVGGKQVLILTLDHTAVNGGREGLNYQKVYYLIKKPTKSLYRFSISSSNGEFDSVEDRDRIHLVEDIISSLEY